MDGNSMGNRAINEKIGAWLLEDGHTRELLARSLGITRPTLQNRLSGKTEWTWEEVIKVSRITGCTLNELSEMTVA